jgi:hypothetical protein
VISYVYNKDKNIEVKSHPKAAFYPHGILNYFNKMILPVIGLFDPLCRTTK